MIPKKLVRVTEVSKKYLISTKIMYKCYATGVLSLVLFILADNYYFFTNIKIL